MDQTWSSWFPAQHHTLRNMTKASVAQNPARNAPRKIRVGSGGHKANAALIGQTGTVRAFRVLPSRVKVVPIR